MDFFERQDAARRKTKWLVLYLILSTALTIGVIYWLLALFFFWQTGGKTPFWHAELFLWVSGILVFIVGLGSLYKVYQLRQGGGAIARMLGGRPVAPHTTDPDEQKLMNVVEEMSIASGTPVPEVYLLEREDSINAFAAGHDPQDAAIGVTRGAMQLLSRDELQGVIAHEFSHILNGDMRLNLRCVGIVHGLLCVAIVGRVLMYTSTRAGYYRLYSRNRGGNPLPLIGLVLYGVGSIGVLFGKLIKSAISRQREYLADSAAVQFTRNPEGLAGALKKIGGLSRGSRVEDAHAEEISHMFFGNALSSSMFSVFSTHPPLEKRIRLLDPAFNGKYPRVEMPARETRQPPPARAQPPGRPPIIPPILPDLLPGQKTGLPPLTPAILLASAGAPTSEHLRFASNLLACLPDELREATHEPFAAVGLVYGLLLSPDEGSRAAQIAELEKTVSRSILTEVERLLPAIIALESRAKLPLVELALPALRQLSPSQYEHFSQDVRMIIASDRQIDLFEYALEKMLLRHLEPHFKQTRRPVTQYYVLKPLAADCAVLLSALAHIGHDDPDEIAAAFHLGAAQLNLQGGELRLLPQRESNLPQIDKALERLAQGAMPVRKQVINACAHAVAADGKIHEKESELLRAIADGLECPLPPMLT